MLQTIYYEPRRECVRLDQQETDESDLVLFESLNSCRVTKVVVFEDFNDSYTRVPQPSGTCLSSAEPLREASDTVSGTLAQASLRLESLSASFIVDARYFFSACQPTWVWARLASLALTSRILVPGDQYCVEINGVLRVAATIAVKMPRLNTMVLWNYERKAVCAFIYQAFEVEQWAKVTWRATWDVVLEPAVVRAWEVVALEYVSSKLSIVKEVLDPDVALKLHSDAIGCLKFSCEVLHQGSLRQNQEEALC